MASQNRLFAYFASAKGRRFTFYASVSAAMGAFSLHFVPQSFLLWKHREIVASYHEGSELQVPTNIKKRFEMAQDYLGIGDFEKKFFIPFMVTGFDTYHIGSTKFRFGALVGIPINYTYTAKDDIDKSQVIVRGKPVDWNSQGGQLLEQSLVLTEDEQIFGIAREDLQLQNHSVFLRSLYASGTIVLVYTLTSTLNSKLRLFYRPLSLRVALYGIAYSFGYGIYTLLTDYTQVSYDGETDETLASLGPNFIDAGGRFYNKLCNKNIAVRLLTGDNSQYTASGNENFMIRQMRLPLTIRKTFFELKLEELKKQAESSDKS